MAGQLRIQAGSLDEIAGVQCIAGERLGQRSEGPIDGEELRKMQGKVEVGSVQQKWPALLMVFQWRQLVGEAAHDIYECALAGFRSRAPRAEVAGEQGVYLIRALSDISDKARIC